MFTGVPFTFGQRIDVSLGLSVSADVNAIDAGATCRAEANYGHTMTWSGISEVRDSSGRVLATFSAVSADSGFNFALVPEPASWILLVAGLLMLGWRTRRATHLQAVESLRVTEAKTPPPPRCAP